MASSINVAGVTTYRRGFVDLKTTASDLLCTMASSVGNVTVTDIAKSFQVSCTASSLTFVPSADVDADLESRGSFALLLFGGLALFLDWLHVHKLASCVTVSVVRDSKQDRAANKLHVQMHAASGKSKRADVPFSSVMDMRSDCIRDMLADVQMGLAHFWPVLKSITVSSREALHKDVRLATLVSLFPCVLALDRDDPCRDVLVHDTSGTGLSFFVNVAQGYDGSWKSWDPMRGSLARLLLDDAHEIWSEVAVDTDQSDFVETFCRLANVQCIWPASNQQLTILPDCLVITLPFSRYDETEWILSCANDAAAVYFGPNHLRGQYGVSCITVMKDSLVEGGCVVVVSVASPACGAPLHHHPEANLCTPLPISSADLAAMADNFECVSRVVVYTGDRQAVRRTSLHTFGLHFLSRNSNLSMTCKIGLQVAKFQLLVFKSERDEKMTLSAPALDWKPSSSVLLTLLHKACDSKVSRATAAKKPAKRPCKKPKAKPKRFAKCS